VSSSERVACLRAARDLMDRRFADPLDLSQLAAHAGFSKFYFVRAFKDAYGETPARYLTRRRVERAKDLLRWANLTVTEVCMLVGFSSLGSFSRRFSELVGMAPSTFQRMSAARGGPAPVPGCFVMDWAKPRPQPTALRGRRVHADCGSGTPVEKSNSG
jgi:AraC-like DNA-binding protein